VFDVEADELVGDVHVGAEFDELAVEEDQAGVGGQRGVACYVL